MSSEEYPFALCLTHDVDRPTKTYQAISGALGALGRGSPLRAGYHLRTLAANGDADPYWQFDRILDLETDLGVRSAFYFLDEPSLLRDAPESLASPRRWIEHAGRYDPTTGEIADVIRRLDDGGWEVGLHGSYGSPDDPTRLAAEKRALESVLGHEVSGIRQHHLRLDPATWRHHAGLGFDYDASLGLTDDVGFAYGYRTQEPLSGFQVFPLTAMEIAFPDPGDSYPAAIAACERLLGEAEREGAVFTALWHPRLFSEREFPGYSRLYRHLVERALEMGAWVGTPRAYLEEQPLGPLGGAGRATDSA
ncbi:polysaccharide deacetylase family protein [Halospeciosus flavus]|uniref:Polysaccharide deacetylase family protein n=1 Tax=Halospeciosus flavus TaxID=3032283 RepID=A0ABD5Z120_9EURY|nr:polysaccharide deacetylase family protein [Halospeciosus flavus]